MTEVIGLDKVTLRDLYASHAMEALLTDYDNRMETFEDFAAGIARAAFIAADAMLAARGKESAS